MHPDCLFCDIARGRSPAHVVFEDRRFIVFADRAPIRPGHLQIVPRAHYPCFDDLPPALAGGLIRLGQRLAKVLKAEYRVARVGFVLTGNDVPHVHAHLVPMQEASDITSRRYIPLDEVPFAAPEPLDRGVLSDTADRLRARLAALEALV
ncbi:HIT family protein [Salipiger sp. P9]|uniref:HIT family protein n=1 Tax=Salipiger pentaromativorans TaxID=2943193 RepID=UPI002158848A|nr:HIT family protein [Salipiger pentaromativorans]MCR8546543.1 HIT family protein [Salipiger pentaromativorans]